MNREQHLAWAKQRAYEYLNRGDTKNAFASIASDLQKHDDTRDHEAIQLGMGLIMIGNLRTVSEMRKFIDDIQ